MTKRELLAWLRNARHGCQLRDPQRGHFLPYADRKGPQ